MGKTVMLLVGFAVALASAESDYNFLISEDKEVLNFTLSDNRVTFLAFWTSYRNAKIIIELRWNLVPGSEEQAFFSRPYQPFPEEMWHFTEIWMKNSTVEIYTTRLPVEVKTSGVKVSMNIFSSRKIYWKKCTNYYSCNLPGPESIRESTTVALLITCCLLVVTVAVLVGYIIRRKTVDNRAQTNEQDENIYEEVDLYSIQGHKETINPIYDSVSHKQ
ncbi:uncharacterized protein [Macrobrachium rosenbergii]|uniref:uncharacterized protein n=1 Tax=Macrobrachium rosenbergii TaxID=79674 RepID=UPI0034D58A64